MLQTTLPKWTHPSVLSMTEGQDAIEKLVGDARQMALAAIDSGWSGPPYDPFKLAEILSIPVIPRDDIRDARISPSNGPYKYQIEYNPNRPRQRIRFSIAHEIAHTLFPDCGQSIRNRSLKHETEGDDWQLEMLCNIAASEILMPTTNLPTLGDEHLSIDKLVKLRENFDVSTEAILLRYARVTRHPCFVFAASRIEICDNVGPYRIDYAIKPTGWATEIASGLELPASTVIRQCTAIDYTAKGNELWPGCDESIHIEAVGIPPYLGHSFPRVVGIGWPMISHPALNDLLTRLKGDAAEPRGSGDKIIVHIVNDAASHWGGGFAGVIRAKWPLAEQDFTEWVETDRRRLQLGACHFARVQPGLTIVSMIAQHGFGPSQQPRIRYAAVEQCLTHVASIATATGDPVPVHMPMIGTGQAGGRWDVIEELVRDTLIQRGVPVTVYDLPKKGKKAFKQGPLLFE